MPFRVRDLFDILDPGLMGGSVDKDVEAADFLHPRVPSGHPLQPHVLYRISREQWEAQR